MSLLNLTHDVRAQHTLLLGSSGSGKSRSIEFMICSDLDREEKISTMLIDPHGEQVARLKRLSCFANNDRLLVIDPAEQDLALNLFALGSENSAAGVSEAEINASVGLIEYIIGGLLGDMTDKQTTVFRFLARLMLSLEGSTIFTLLELLQSPKDFEGAMRALPEIPRKFFVEQFLDKSYNATRKQLSDRLWRVLDTPTFARVFGAKRNTLDLYKALNSARTVLCHTNRGLLGDQSVVVARYLIALAGSAAFRRAGLPSGKLAPTYIYLDECGSYLDGNMTKVLLSEIRKFRCGLILSAQSLSQLTLEVRDAVMSNTAVKLASCSAKDAKALSADMETTEEFILQQKKQGNRARWACHVKGVTTKGAVSLEIPLGTVEGRKQMTKEEFSAVMERNRREMCASSDGERHAD
jgi:hypothetical protein